MWPEFEACCNAESMAGDGGSAVIVRGIERLTILPRWL